MILEQWTGPPVETHTYLLADERSGEAWAIDAPLDTAALLSARARELRLHLSRLVLTHGHFDHILDVPEFTGEGVATAAHPLERTILDAPQTALFGLPYEMPRVTIKEELAEGQTLRLGDDEWQVWHVPGHSPGHVILYSPANALVMGGDLLFAGGYGRVDLPGCDPGAMIESLRRLLALPDQTRVYPGHGPATTIGAERRWLAPALERGSI